MKTSHDRRQDWGLRCLAATFFFLTAPARIVVAEGNDTLDTNSVFRVQSPELNSGVSSFREKVLSRVRAADLPTETINALGNRDVVIDKGKKRRVSTLAAQELMPLGEPALPQLIAATEDVNPRVRAHALDVIYQISSSSDLIADVLPVLLRSQLDKSDKVRTAATALIGQFCVKLWRNKEIGELETIVKHLENALNDDSKEVQLTAGAYLFSIGKQSLVPQHIVDEAHLDETIICF